MLSNIKNIKISNEQINKIESHLKTLIDEIDYIKPQLSNEEKQKKLFSLIEERMYKYAFRLAEEHKVKKEKDIKEMFYSIVGNIANYCDEICRKEEIISQEEINTIHTKMYPKGLWGPSIDTKGNRVFQLYPTGNYRKARDFKKTQFGEHDYIDFELIEESIDIANNFLLNGENHPLVKIATYLLLVWQIHPYYNGNGTLYLFVIAILLLQNGYDIPQNIIPYLQHTVDDGILDLSNEGNILPFIEGFLLLFSSKNQ